MKFSIIIPVFNREDTIKRCLDSVIYQSFNDYEVIVVDDFSTDNTCKIVENYCNKYKNIKLIRLEKNVGFPDARSIGVKEAIADYVIFLDSDDYFRPESLILVYEYLLKYPDYKQYLLPVNYRVKIENIYKEIVYYKDWISEKYKNDYTHIIMTSILKKHTFESIMHEKCYDKWKKIYLNEKNVLSNVDLKNLYGWFILHKYTEPQLYLNINLSIIDRNRVDSVSLFHKVNLREKIFAMHEYYSLLLINFQEDYYKYFPKKVIFKWFILNNLMSKKYLTYEFLSNYLSTSKRGRLWFISKLLGMKIIGYLFYLILYIKYSYKRG